MVILLFVPFCLQLIEDVLVMYDLLTIWDVDNSWPEMEQLGLRILLAFAAQQDIVVRYKQYHVAVT